MNTNDDDILLFLSAGTWMHPKWKKHHLLPPRRRTWQWKITILNRRCIFKLLFFHCHVSFPGCKSSSQEANMYYIELSGFWKSAKNLGAFGHKKTHLQRGLVSKWRTFPFLPPKKYGRFQKSGYPQIINFNRVFPYNPSILAYHYFWKYPYPFRSGCTCWFITVGWHFAECHWSGLQSYRGVTISWPTCVWSKAIMRQSGAPLLSGVKCSQKLCPTLPTYL